jgi:hypothetical protein
MDEKRERQSRQTNVSFKPSKWVAGQANGKWDLQTGEK